jgi:hypothetical protein
MLMGCMSQVMWKVMLARTSADPDLVMGRSMTSLRPWFIHVGHGDAGPNQVDASHETCETYEMAHVLAETFAREDKTNVTFLLVALGCGCS